MSSEVEMLLKILFSWLPLRSGVFANLPRHSNEPSAILLRDARPQGNQPADTVWAWQDVDRKRAL